MLRSDGSIDGSGHYDSDSDSYHGSTVGAPLSSPTPRSVGGDRSPSSTVLTSTSQPDFEQLFRQDLTPNKRAVMEALLQGFVSGPSRVRSVSSVAG